jgi:hypothetical protein
LMVLMGTESPAAAGTNQELLLNVPVPGSYGPAADEAVQMP